MRLVAIIKTDMPELTEQVALIYGRAKRFFRNQQYDEAAFLLHECLKLSPDAIEPLYKLGQLEQKRGNVDECLYYFDRARTLDSSYQNIALRCARILFQLNRADEALNRVDEHLAAHPGHGPAHHLRALILSQIRPTSQTPIHSNQRPPLKIFLSIIFALMTRELRIRFDRSRFGYVWIFLEPALQISVMWIVYAVLRVGHPLGNTSLVAFLVMGVTPWLMFRYTISECMAAIGSNAALFDYRQIRPLDVVLALWLLQITIFLLTYSIFAILLGCIGISAPMHDPLRWFAAIFLMALLGLGLGLIVAVACSLHIEWRRIIKPTLRFMNFVSGVYFTMNMLPEPIRSYLSWNPLLQVMDLLKSAAYPSYTSPASWNYTAMWAFGSLAIGLAYYRHNLRRILQS